MALRFDQISEGDRLQSLSRLSFTPPAQQQPWNTNPSAAAAAAAGTVDRNSVGLTATKDVMAMKRDRATLTAAMSASHLPLRMSTPQVTVTPELPLAATTRAVPSAFVTSKFPVRQGQVEHPDVTLLASEVHARQGLSQALLSEFRSETTHRDELLTPFRDTKALARRMHESNLAFGVGVKPGWTPDASHHSRTQSSCGYGTDVHSLSRATYGQLPKGFLQASVAENLRVRHMGAFGGSSQPRVAAESTLFTTPLAGSAGAWETQSQAAYRHGTDAAGRKVSGDAEHQPHYIEPPSLCLGALKQNLSLHDEAGDQMLKDGTHCMSIYQHDIGRRQIPPRVAANGYAYGRSLALSKLPPPARQSTPDPVLLSQHQKKQQFLQRQAIYQGSLAACSGVPVRGAEVQSAVARQEEVIRATEQKTGLPTAVNDPIVAEDLTHVENHVAKRAPGAISWHGHTVVLGSYNGEPATTLAFQRGPEHPRAPRDFAARDRRDRRGVVTTAQREGKIILADMAPEPCALSPSSAKLHNSLYRDTFRHGK
jgi:hypothetical protein